MASNFKDYVGKIDALDFKLTKFKLCLPEEEGGKNWSGQQAERNEVWYKRFLKLRVLYGNKVLVPTKDIDDFWHAHILDTFRYHDDCQDIFGKYIHHYPYFGLRGPEDAQKMQEAFLETMELFQKHFGKKPPIPTKVNKGSHHTSRGGMNCG